MSQLIGEAELRFLAKDGKFPSKVESLTPEASTRRYYRIFYPNETLVLCKDAQFQHDFIDVGNFLRSHGFRVPDVYKTDIIHHLTLLSDEGDKDLSFIKDDGEYRDYLVKSIELLVKLQKLETEAPVSGREFDYEKLNYENQFTVSAFGRFSKLFGIKSELRPEVNIFIEEASSFLSDYKIKVFCHRDFHARNLMLNSEQQITMIDFQDARMGTPFYDLSSLLYDAYRPIPFAMRKGLFLLFLKLSETNYPKPKECFYLQSLQRSYKALGSYFMLVADKGQDKYRSSIIACLDNLLEIVQVGLFPDQLFVFFHFLRKELLANRSFLEKIDC
ncbi:phosphotransferase enzyme family protein [Leptospira broomii serovar Hurstbridge str. 5399]|uniref:Phosphotransferase enzyme family protein n=1 Tax=Leptospira broomii serovar Hurstbridge str. 5399 TaxID=1049789 RepID=T0GFH7_9LEPT|nr:phosphotransferase [Leptospira broomii]EQA44138.1 phosphotransferase enzyme family protein [Leptospira broomii serovar Hurstbridge str. 5399]